MPVPSLLQATRLQPAGTESENTHDLTHVTRILPSSIFMSQGEKSEC